MRTRLSVPDISCEGCKTTLEAALAPVGAIEAVEVDVAGQVVDVLHEPSLDAAELERLIEDQGYEVAAREEVG